MPEAAAGENLQRLVASMMLSVDLGSVHEDVQGMQQSVAELLQPLQNSFKLAWMLDDVAWPPPESSESL